MTTAGPTFRFEAGTEDDGMRLDAFLAERMTPEEARSGAPVERVTRARVQRWIDDGRVTLDGKPAKSSARVRPGAIASVDVPAPAPIDVVPERIPLDVLHEDADVIVVVKPAGMSTHPGAGVSHGTLVNALLAHIPDLSGIGDALRPGIVHRLDKDTTGVMVVAKSELAHQSLSKQFHDHTVSRRYRALAWGDVPAKLTIDARIARDPRERKRFAVTGDPAAGKHAVTHVTRLESLPEASLVECVLETGRTHQIRVHLASKGHPLVGDRVYGGARVPARVKGALRDAASSARRQMLHAASLAFDHPRTGARLSFEAPLPADFAALLAAFRDARSVQ